MRIAAFVFLGALAGQGLGAGPQSGQALTARPQTGQAFGAGPQTGQAPTARPQTGQALGAGPQSAPTPASGPQSGQALGAHPQSGQALGAGPQSAQAPTARPQTGQAFGAGPQSAQALGAGPQSAPAPASGPQTGTGDVRLPYVYTKWKQFTVKDGLPSDHIFAVKVDGPRVWIGTEDGLAMLDKRTGKIKSWTEKDGLPFRAVTSIDVDRKTGDVWLGLFGGGLARFSGGHFDHWHQLNSGLVNDVVYGVAVENDNIWAATTAGASRYNIKTHEWSIFTEKNAPMEEIWNYNVSYNGADKVFLAVWGSGVLEYNIKAERWKDYLDPDGEMEIDLYRDDGIIHVIVTGAQEAEGVLWASAYFGGSRYDGRNWRGYYNQDSGLPSDFNNNVRARSANEAWFCSDKGAGVITDFASNTWVAYTRNPDGKGGKAVVTRDKEVLETVEMPIGIPHNFIINADIDGNDVWLATAQGLGWGTGEGYYPGLRERTRTTEARAVPKGGSK